MSTCTSFVWAASSLMRGAPRLQLLFLVQLAEPLRRGDAQLLRRRTTDLNPEYEEGEMAETISPRVSIQLPQRLR
jgi:hypothetical protein